MIKIEEEIVGFKVKSTTDTPKPAQELPLEIMSEKVKRPEILEGKTYKIKLPTEECATYVTINDMILNENTPKEERRPYEIFINNKSTAHRQWIDTITRVISAVFRKGGSYDFLVEELKAVGDPNGGVWHKGRYIKSLVSEIGNVLEQHISYSSSSKVTEVQDSESHEILGASKCVTCGAMAVVQKDGCPTCLACGDSKCG